MSASDGKSCMEMNALLAERASGPLETAEAAALDAHLQSCNLCRAAAAQWETLFSHVGLPPLKAKEEASLRDLPQRLWVAWAAQERRRRRLPAVAGVGGLLAAAAALLFLWHEPQKPTLARVATPALAQVVEGTPSVQVEWTDGPTWEMDEVDVGDASTDDGALLDGLALEGDGAFSLGDSG
jgi:ferric-dicitrate binding protein FerR (iron transport regulator)